jgi:shikimate kinase
VAPILAGELGLDWVDLDAVVESASGRTVAAIFATDGVAAFRDLETRALLDVLAGPPVVVATGGGVVLAPGNRRALVERSRVVWLRTPVEVLAGRLARDEQVRPLLVDDDGSALQRLADEREALYADVAEWTFDTDESDGPAVAAAIVAALSGADRVGRTSGAADRG